MNAKNLKDWVNSLPDDALIQVLAAPHMSFPLTNPVLHAIDRKTIKSVTGKIVSGKVISSFPEIRPMEDLQIDLRTESNQKRS
jgi:hypothetical protein